jgi:hypothetical protein
MKKYLMGTLAIVMAIGTLAFTSAKPNNTNTLRYWYHTMDDGTVINPGAPPPSSTSSDLFNCGGGPTKFCSKAYSDYNHTTFEPVGDPQLIVKKPNQ